MGGAKFIGVKTLIADGEQRWHERYNTPVKYVGGEDNQYQWFIIYGKDRPHVIQPWSMEKHMPPNVYNREITEAEIRQHGALLLGKNTMIVPMKTSLRFVSSGHSLR